MSEKRENMFFYAFKVECFVSSLFQIKENFMNCKDMEGIP